VKHVHAYERIPMTFHARCTVCGLRRRLEDLVYFGEAPRSIGNGTTSWRTTT
jgi:hypothetical protein